MNRRQFIQEVMRWSAGLSLAVPQFTWGAEGGGAEPVVAVAKGTEYQTLVHTVLDALGGMGQFVRPGYTVVIKPNIGWDRTPEQAANTHPLVVKAMAEEALEAGAGKVVVFDRPCNEKRRCYVNSGIQAALEKIGSRQVRCAHIDSRKFVPVDIVQGKAVRSLSLYQDALTADCYINLPVAKHHGLSRLTLGLKNNMGVLGGVRGVLHHNLGQKLADLATVIRPQLTVIDATRILLRNGPQGGNLKDVQVMDTLIASTDPVAADAYATTLFGLVPEDIESTVAAAQMGLGVMDLSKMRILSL